MRDQYQLLDGRILHNLHRDLVRALAGEFLFRMSWTPATAKEEEAIYDNFALVLHSFQGEEARRLKQERIARDMAQFYREQEATYFPPMEEKS
jgi:hypothetical protein